MIETSSPLESVFGTLPAKLRAELLETFGSILQNFREERWAPSELDGGKFCEVVYSILRGLADGALPNRSKKPKNMVDACRALEQAAASLPRSVRIQMPRALIMLYEIRNNRGVGHVGGDVDPSHMDSSVVVAVAKWVVAELVRILHDTDVATASALVDQLIERELPLVWEVQGRKRVLRPGMSMKDKTLVLLYSSKDGLTEPDLVTWVEHSNPSAYRRDVLRSCHKAKLLEYDPNTRFVVISPLGVRHVEDLLAAS